MKRRVEKKRRNAFKRAVRLFIKRSMRGRPFETFVRDFGPSAKFYFEEYELSPSLVFDQEATR